MSAVLKDNIKEKVDELCNDLKRKVYGNYLNRIDEIERALSDLKLELKELDYQEKLSEYREELHKDSHIVRDENDL